jgi:GTP-binding protein
MRPLVAIVGRPNVGKSSLFNRLVGQPIAIVDPTPGTTRDRIIHEVRRDDVVFDLVDTGGIGIVDEAKLELDVGKQIERALATADRIIFLVDARDGVLPLDREIAARLRPLRDRVILAANKVDHPGLEPEIHAFLTLGLGDPVALSATQATGLHELVEAVCRDLPAAHAADAPQRIAADGTIKLALVGRRNVGKSSLTNALVGENRVIVADLPGTTRDAVDVAIERPQGKFTLIDTAGLRRLQKMRGDDLEFYSAARTERAIRRADVVLFVVDAGEELGALDRKIAHFITNEGKPLVLVLNKWDIAAAGGAKLDGYRKWLEDRIPEIAYAPLVTTCALTGYKVDELLGTAVELVEEARFRAPTAEVNRLLKAATSRRRPRKTGTSNTRIYYATQAECEPPTFVFFVNRTDWVEASYSRYLENFLRDHLPCRRVPLRILFKHRESDRTEGLDEQLIVTGRNKAERNPSLAVPAGARAKQGRGQGLARRRRKDAAGPGEAVDAGHGSGFAGDEDAGSSAGIDDQAELRQPPRGIGDRPVRTRRSRQRDDRR